MGSDVDNNFILINNITINSMSFSKLNKDDFDCIGSELKNNVAKFTCKMKTSQIGKGFTRGDGNFYGKLSINLGYYYQDMIGLDLTIEKWRKYQNF